MIRILIIEDDWNAREGLKECCADEPDFEVVGTAQTEGEALELLATYQPDVVVPDVRLHEEEAEPKIVAEIRARGWVTRMLAYSAHDTPEIVQKMLDAGTLGLLCEGRQELPDMDDGHSHRGGGQPLVRTWARGVEVAQTAKSGNLSADSQRTKENCPSHTGNGQLTIKN